MHFMGENWVLKRSRKGLGETLTIKKHFLTFTLSVNKTTKNQFSMFKSLDSIASVIGIFMYLTISKFKQVLRSRKGLGKVSTTTLVSVLLTLDLYPLLCTTIKQNPVTAKSKMYVLFWLFQFKFSCWKPAVPVTCTIFELLTATLWALLGHLR